MTIELTVTGMSCGGCAASLRKALMAQPAVRIATVDFASRKAVIESELSKAELIALIEARGFQVE
ncbi:heavy metal-associated domain-containing protein [Aeromonas caviae]|uniref:heavy-metal-associated domain-containing protein n=1 Tax=Aeromonas caviae TaxID=648 RepID=UPI0029D6C1BE|nr:heavy metal-associated domain-containing protein [Aeromonas caviae]MDX7807736.1 heavy metal-associated domain-containing protein [Aeromonas caviae]